MQKSKREPEQRLILEDEATEKPKHKPEHALMEVIGFTEDDLEANREGYLSEDQRREFERIRNKLFIAATVLTIVFPLACISSLIVILGYQNPAQEIFVAFAALLGLLFSWSRWKVLNRDYLTQKIGAAEGRIHLNVDSNRFVMSIQNLKFKTTKEIFLAFKNGDPYIIYFAPHSKTILSAEWLREG